MKKEDCGNLEFFSWSEVQRASDDPKMVSYGLMRSLDMLRTLLGVPIRVNYLNKGRHSAGSLHNIGAAADCEVCGDIPTNTVVQKALDCMLNGVGVYKTFYHFDQRPKTALWYRNSGGIYLPLISTKGLEL